MCVCVCVCVCDILYHTHTHTQKQDIQRRDLFFNKLFCYIVAEGFFLYYHFSLVIFYHSG